MAEPAVNYLFAANRAPLPAPLREAVEKWPHVSNAFALSILRQATLESGELSTARAISAALAEMARTAGNVAHMADATLAVAFCDHMLVNWNSAVARAFEVTQLLDESADAALVVRALGLLADIDASRGNASARITCARIRDLAEQLSDATYAVLADRREALLDIPGPDPSSALPALFAARNRYHRAGLRHPYPSPVPDLVEVLVRLGRREQAAALAPEFLDLLGPAAPAPPRARALRIRGLLAASADYDDLFDASITADETTGQSFHAARTMLCQGERRRRDGRRVDARHRLEAALDIFRRADATPWVRRTETELVACGVAVAPRPSTPAPTLTNQELQIATLVAEGRRNHEIAATLYLSTKTVEFHLTRAYRKSGVRNRTQLAALMRSGQPRG